MHDKTKSLTLLTQIYDSCVAFECIAVHSSNTQPNKCSQGFIDMLAVL